MPTFMTKPTFDGLVAIWQQLSSKSTEGMEPSNSFVPWAGESVVAKARGIYYVGIATAAESAYGDHTSRRVFDLPRTSVWNQVESTPLSRGS